MRGPVTLGTHLDRQVLPFSNEVGEIFPQIRDTSFMLSCPCREGIDDHGLQIPRDCLMRFGDGSRFMFEAYKSGVLAKYYYSERNAHLQWSYVDQRHRL